MKRILGVSVFAIVIGIYAHGDSVKFAGSGFSAPNVNDANNIKNPTPGDIVLQVPDVGTPIFRGHDGTQWIDFAGGSSGSENDPSALLNLGIEASTVVVGNALTLSLKQADGFSDPSAGNPVKIAFRSSTDTSGAIILRTVTGPLSLTVPPTATLGHASGLDGWLFLYAIDNGGTVELAIASMYYDEGELHNTAQITTGSLDNNLYSTTARTNVPIRLIARMKSNQASAGTWNTVPKVSVMQPGVDRVPVENFYVAKPNDLPDISTNVSATASGMSLTLPPGIYEIGYTAVVAVRIFGLNTNKVNYTTTILRKHDFFNIPWRISWGFGAVDL